MLATIIQSTRPPFLLLTPACLIPAIILADQSAPSLSTINVILVLFGAVCAHISVNCFNEYFDYKSGLDAMTKKTPFSGGSGALIENPQHLSGVLVAAVLTLLVTVLVGLYFAMQLGLTIIPIGLIGVVMIYAYTQYINSYPWMCLLSPGLAFGPLMMVGCYWVLSGHISAEIILASLLPFCLVNNLLLINQIPDIEADKQVGRRTFPIVYDVAGAQKAYLAMTILALICFVAVSVMMELNIWAGLMILPIILSFFAYSGLKRNGADTEKLIPFMALTVVSALTLPLTMAASIHFGSTA